MWVLFPEVVNLLIWPNQNEDMNLGSYQLRQCPEGDERQLSALQQPQHWEKMDSAFLNQDGAVHPRFYWVIFSDSGMIEEPKLFSFNCEQIYLVHCALM